jgi:hypothetical protein
MDEIKQMLAKRRPSLSESTFTKEQFTSFVRANRDAANKPAIIRDVAPIIWGRTHMFRAQNVDFIRLQEISRAPTYNGPIRAKPDYFEGVRREDIDLRIQQSLIGYIVPHPDPCYPALPNLFAEYKSDDGSQRVAMLKACYEGALGARGMWKFQMFGEPTPTFDNRAYTITMTYCAGLLCLNSVHLAKSNSSNSDLEYHQCRIDSWSIVGNRRSYLDAATAYRNACEWAEKQRREALNQAHARLAAANGDTPTSTSPPFATAPPPSSLTPSRPYRTRALQAKRLATVKRLPATKRRANRRKPTT